MRRAMWVVVAALGLIVVGCASRPQLTDRLEYPLVYRAAPVPVSEMRILVAPFEDLREVNRTSRLTLVPHLLPFVHYSSAVNSHLDARYGRVRPRLGRTHPFAVVIPQLLADHLVDANVSPNVMFVTEYELKEAEGYDLVLRGKLLDADLTTHRYSYGLGPAAVVPYLFGARIVRYEPTLTVSWKLYDAEGNAVSNTQLAAVPGPASRGRNTGLYYGQYTNKVGNPMGLYAKVIEDVNTQITTKVLNLIAE